MGGTSKHHLKRKSEVEMGEHSELHGLCGRVKGDWVTGVSKAGGSKREMAALASV